MQCTKCEEPVSYTDEVIKDQVIAGIADSEIQKDVLSHPEAKVFDLEKLLSFIEGKESGMTSQGLMSGNKVESVTEPIKKVKNCKFCGDSHIFGKKNCKAAGKECVNCGKKDHLAKVCRSSKKSEAKVEAAEGAGTQVQAGAQRVADSNWACGALQGEEVDHCFTSYQNSQHGFYNENKTFDTYTPCFYSDKNYEEVLKNKEKRGATHPGFIKRGNKNKRSKKVGSPTLVKTKSSLGIAELGIVNQISNHVLPSIK